VKNDAMGWECRTDGEKKNLRRISVCKPKKKRPLGRHRLRYVDNIKIYLKETKWDGVN
jgi:hypothetical protein